jgi:hypothetical protein
MRWTTVLIDHPWLALIAAALLVGLWVTSRSRSALAAALLWVAYAVWEFAVSESSPDANIRIDLFLIYPVLLVITAAGLCCAIRSLTK